MISKPSKASYQYHRERPPVNSTETVRDSSRRKVMERPIIVCLCGSTRYPDTLKEAYLLEVMAGRIPLIFLTGSREWHDNAEVKAQLDKIYLRKIDLADEILVLNVGGYVGESTSNEVRYAREQGKKIRWWEPPPKEE